MELTLIGQSTVLIKMSGLRMMTDPWWGQFEFLRGVPIAYNPETIDQLDLMLVSHNHIDHWCTPAIRLAKRLGTYVVGSNKSIKRARKHGLSQVLVMAPGDVHEYKGIKIHAVPARHPFAKDAVGFVVEGEKTFYFSGDTLYFPELEEALVRFSLDAALVQVACSTYPVVGADGMDLEQAAVLARRVNPKVTIPIHYQVKGKTIPEETLQAWNISTDLVVLKPGITQTLE